MLCAHPGCMDRASVVFDSRATYDDGSCYAYVLGCTDSLAQASPIFNAIPNPHLNLNPNLNTNPNPDPKPLSELPPERDSARRVRLRQRMRARRQW